MSIDTFCRDLQDLTSRTASDARLATVARAIAGHFGVAEHEVAFFQIDTNGRQALFRWPPTQGAMHISLKSFATSLVTATSRERHGQLNNSFGATPHLHMYEHLLADREQRIPVQKIISAPAAHGDTLCWVIQVSRKGVTPQAAGPDFTAENLADLERIAATIATLVL